jgi:hypothetical protein
MEDKMKIVAEKTDESPIRLVAVETAGTIIGLGKWRIRSLVYSGELPYVRLGRRVMIDIRDIELFIESHKTREGRR